MTKKLIALCGISLAASLVAQAAAAHDFTVRPDWQLPPTAISSAKYVERSNAVYFEHAGQVYWFPKLSATMADGPGDKHTIAFGYSDANIVSDPGELDSSWAGKPVLPYSTKGVTSDCKFNAPPLVRGLSRAESAMGRQLGPATKVFCSFEFKTKSSREWELRNLVRNNQIVSLTVDLAPVPLVVTADGVKGGDGGSAPGEPEPDPGQDNPKPDPGEENPQPDPGDKPKLPPGDQAQIIKHGWDVPLASALSRPEFVKEVADSPFDGVVFSAQESGRFLSERTISYEQARSRLAAHREADFGRPMNNYLIIYVDTFGGGWGNKEDVDRVANNARNLGRAAKEAGFAGVLFDNEVYEGDLWGHRQGACKRPSLGFQDCRKAAYDGGKAIVDGLIDGWPDVTFMPMFGIWLDDPRTAPHVSQYAHAGQWAEPNNDVDADFLAGAFEATLGTSARFVDGGELYGLREREHYRKTAEWMRRGTVEDNRFLPEELRDDYSNNIGIGFGLYDGRDGLFERQMGDVTPSVWEKMIDGSKRESDIVWLYTEIHDWWHKDGNDWPTTEKEGSLGRINKSGDWYQATVRGIGR